MRAGLRFLALAFLGVALGHGPVHAASDDWEFMLAPYLWASGIEGDVAVLGQPAEVDQSFSDIVDVLDGGVLLHFEAAHEKWTILSDLVFLDLGVGLETPSGELDYEQWIVEGAGAYGVRENVDFLFGARYIRLDAELRFSGLALNPQRDRSWIDPFVGLRWATLGERWGFSLRGDIGGFGVESDLTWQLRATGTYRFSDRVFLGFGFRVLDHDFEDGAGLSRFVYDLTLSGTEIGVGFNF